MMKCWSYCKVNIYIKSIHSTQSSIFISLSFVPIPRRTTSSLWCICCKYCFLIQRVSPQSVFIDIFPIIYSPISKWLKYGNTWHSSNETIPLPKGTRMITITITSPTAMQRITTVTPITIITTVLIHVEEIITSIDISLEYIFFLWEGSESV